MSWTALVERVGQQWRRSRRGAGNLEIELVAPRLVYENPFVRIFDDDVRIRRSEATPRYLRITAARGASDGAVVMAVTPDDHVLLVRQFRHPMRLWMAELPRGFAKPGQDDRATAGRELSEETGHRLDLATLIPLGRIAPDSGKLHDAPYLFLCRATPTGLPAGYTDPDSTEPIANVVKIRFSQLRQLCERGELIDAFTLATVLRAVPHFDGDILRPDESLLDASPMLSTSDTLTYEDGSAEPTDADMLD